MTSQLTDSDEADDRPHESSVLPALEHMAHTNFLDVS